MEDCVAASQAFLDNQILIGVAIAERPDVIDGIG
jgi:hypothetical protein